MVYTQLTTSPAIIQFCRSLGGNGTHIGILGALPTGMLFIQFFAALLANHIRHRRWVWFAASCLQRILYVPMALAPLIWPDVSGMIWVWTLLAVMALEQGLLHFSTPLWLSWMGDYLPHEGLNTFWGIRQVWMQWLAAFSLLGGSMLLLKSGLEIGPAFLLLASVAAVFGLADLMLFLKIEEPLAKRDPNPQTFKVLLQPFKHADFRRFILFTSFWHVAAMVGAPFISLFLLDYIGMDLFSVMMLWTCSWIGGALFSRKIGAWVEEYGHRPILILSTALKPLNMLALLVIPRDPTIALCVLIPVFMLDQMLNAGITIANNGFMIKNSPAQNRTMFIASGTALAGLIGGITSVVSGICLTSMSSWTFYLFDTNFVNYHVLFAISFVLRVASAVLAPWLREPKSQQVKHVLSELVGGVPWRVLRFSIRLEFSSRSRKAYRLPRTAHAHLSKAAPHRPLAEPASKLSKEKQPLVVSP
ncbi:MAG: MFS transporter [Planctomycetaceae bacterium]